MCVSTDAAAGNVDKVLRTRADVDTELATHWRLLAFTHRVSNAIVRHVAVVQLYNTSGSLGHQVIY